MKILIIEDDQSVAELERDYLEINGGFDCDLYDNGNQGLQAALSQDYALVIVDVMLPGLSGFEICRRLREVKDTPVIIISALADDIDKVRGLGLGADDYMTKPFSPSELVAAISQMRGGYSQRISGLRDQLLEFASLVELELDFSDQDVEFADRTRLSALLSEVRGTLRQLADSFSLGNVIRNGIPVAIAGEPNVGKSTLLNALLGEEKALVSPIAGTTRDTIEDRITISGFVFRFIDTAGLRSTDDTVERMGIERAYHKIEQASVVICVLDATDFPPERQQRFFAFRDKYRDKRLLVVWNKVDELSGALPVDIPGVLSISARTGFGLDALRQRLTDFVGQGEVSDRTIVTNARHYDALVRALHSIDDVEAGLSNGLSGDLLAIDLRQAIDALAEITGDITDDDILGSIFSKFCVGK